MGYRILEGDVIEQLKTLADASVDSIVTDPPYGLEFMGKDWDAPWKTDHRQGFDGTIQIPDSPYGRSKVRNGNGASYGADGRVMQTLQNWHFAWAGEALRVLKPGGYLLAFGGSRTYHRLACAVEDAGFEIRDQIMWIYGSGFPKSKNIGDGRGTALKPAHEPIVVARKPLVGTVAANVLAYGTGALNIDACRVGFLSGEREGMYRPMTKNNSIGWKNKSKCMGYNTPDGLPPALGRWPANVIHDGSDEVLEAFPDAPGQLADVKFDAEERKTQNTYGAMKRGHEPSGERVYIDSGGTNFAMKPGARRLDRGSAARFFYCAKASREERNRGCESLGKKPLLWSSGTQSPGTFQAEGTDRSAQNNHPTVKPIDLMAYLCRLVTPAGGVILDLFMGSGSTGIAALREGLSFIGIELNSEYVEIARRRMEADAPLFNKPTSEEGWAEEAG
jgi:site-specific DNA-methyltransferase (adenine-specific)